MEQPSGLIAVLLDDSARNDERDDAAIGLAGFDTPEVEAALVKVASKPTTDEIVAGSCGGSLAEIWLRRGQLDSAVLKRLSAVARQEAVALIEARRPEWLKHLE